MKNDYGFVVTHIPHSSILIPEEYKVGFLLNEKSLQKEIRRMTDAFCDELYDAPEMNNKVVADISRLVCDVERFRDDKQEPRAKFGQGLMYTRTSYMKRLRNNDRGLREKILYEIYDPHHAKLNGTVKKALENYGKCLIIDGHSFNARKIVKPDNIFSLPDFDIGTDSFHTPDGLRDKLCEKVRDIGYKPKINTPYAGAITPMEYYRKDRRVISVMIETNRKLYMNERSMTKTEGFELTREICHELMRTAAEYVRIMEF